MPTIVSHAVAAVALAPLIFPSRPPAHALLAGAVLSAVPDLDVVGFRFGVGYDDLLGHRGLTHSLLFAVVLGVLTAVALAPGAEHARWALYLVLATASHGVLDGFTNGGLGVAYFAPAIPHRYFFPARPIEVSPIGLGPFFSHHGVVVILSELRWIWLPAALIALPLAWARWRDGGRTPRRAAR